MISTWILSAILAGAVALVIRGMIRKRKNRKAGECGSGCSHCSGGCCR